MLAKNSHVADRMVKSIKHIMSISLRLSERGRQDPFAACLASLAAGRCLQLLHRLDVENCAETAVTTLHAIFSMATSPDELQNGVRLDERSVT